MNNKKQTYESPTIDLVVITTEDIITTSFPEEDDSEGF